MAKEDADYERCTHSNSEPTVNDPKIGLGLDEGRAGTFADASHPDPEAHADEKARRGIDDDQVRIFNRVGVQDIARGVEDGPRAYPGHENAFHRSHERLVFGVAELVALVGRFTDLACDEDGQECHHDVHDRGHRL